MNTISNLPPAKAIKA